MASRRKGTDWEGLIRGLGALVILLMGFGVVSGKPGTIASGLISLAVFALVIVFGVGFLVLCYHLAKAVFSRRRFPRENVQIFRKVHTTTAWQPPRSDAPDVPQALDALDWYQLELLVARLFEIKGSRVTLRGGAQADGGVDLVVETDSTRAAVQCKHWRKWECGPAVVRELMGSMVHERFPRGFLVCRKATEAAKRLAGEYPIRIIERVDLIERIEEALDLPESNISEALFSPPKLCPKCGCSMVLRVAKRGKNIGSEFWGCSSYPGCNQKLSV